MYEETSLHSTGRFIEVKETEYLKTCFICSHEGTLEFENTRYCSEEHRRLHHPLSRETPFPFTVQFRSDIGRIMTASRDIQAGEIIFMEEPLIIGPDHNHTPCCLECLTTVDGSFLCPGCNLPMCEELCCYGEEHIIECSIYSALSDKYVVSHYDRPDPIYMTISVLRALLYKGSDPLKYRIIQRLMDHNSEHEKNEENWSYYTKHVVDFLQKIPILDFNRKEIFHVIGSLDVNSVKINGMPNKGQSSGHALYPLTALLSHSCLCNSKTVLDEHYSNVTRATVFIGQGEEITKSYVNPLKPTLVRRSTLKKGWYFDCECSRCLDPSENDTFTGATRCLKCGVGIILSLNPRLDKESLWKCNTCLRPSSGLAVQQLTDYFLDKLSGENSIDALEDLYDKASKLFHHYNYILTLLRIKLNVAYVDLTVRSEDQITPRLELYLRRKELLDDIHTVIQKIEPGYSRRRGISIFETSTCHLQLGSLLYKFDRFPPEEFITLILAEKEELKEGLLCLQESREDSYEGKIYCKIQGAILEADYVMKILETEVLLKMAFD